MMSELEDLWEKLEKIESNSLLKKYLTFDLYQMLKNKTTQLGTTLADVIRSGCLNPDSKVGVYSCDPEAYKVFRPLLHPIVCDYHNVTSAHHPPKHFGIEKNNNFPIIDESGKFIISTRIRVARSFEGFPFPPLITNEQRTKIVDLTLDALATLDDDYKGRYIPVDSLTPEQYQQLVDDHLMYRNDNHTARDAGAYEGWPVGRGIYMNPSRTFLVWLNEGDHLRIISMQKGSDVDAVHRRLAIAIIQLEQKIKFGHDEDYGYLGNYPTNIGTCMRASVLIKIPMLDKKREMLNTICQQYNLQLRGVNGEHTESIDGIYDVSNKRRLGLTEYEVVKEMFFGVRKIIEIEKSLK